MTEYLPPRGIRNNNPGNIRHNPVNKWNGLADPPSDGAFCVFTEAHFGIRALAMLLRKYQSGHNCNSVREILNRFAPPVENDTGAYVAHAAKQLEVTPDAFIDTKDEQTMLKLIAVIIRHENGQQPYTDEQILAGIRA